MNVLQAQPDLNASAMTGGLGAFGVGQPSVTLTIRLIMQGKEVGSIIGKKGDNIKRFREESGAKITISDGSCPERIVTVTGSTDSILKAFALISRKFEEVSNYLDFQDPSNLNNLNPLVSAHSQLSLSSVGTGNGQNGKSNCSLGSAGSLIGQAPVTLKLIVPASQCGSLIGKGGSKIKEIRETTGASIQVASEMLPNSTERAVTLSGSADSITKSIYQICCVMLESPPKGPTIPYRPKPAMPPVFFAGGQAYTIQGQFAIPHPDLTKLHRLALQHAPLLPPGHAGVGSLSPQATLATLANSAASLGHHSAAATNAGVVPSLTTEMTIPNDIIGSVIGKGGAKINEIRQLSGANIKINNSEEGTKDRTVIISGTAEAINLAQYLIATRMLHSNQMSSYSQQQQQQQVPTTSNTTSSSPSSSGTSSNGGSYQQLTNQQLQYALLYKNYVQPFVSQYFPPTTAQYGSSTSGTGTAQYYSSSSAQSAGSYMNGGSGMASGTTVVNNNLNTATGASSRSDSSNSSSSNDGGGVSSGQQHHNHGIYKSDSSHSNGSSALISEVSHHHSSSGHHHGGHHHHHHHHLSHQYSEYELSSNGYHHPHHHHQLMMNSATPSSATNAYAASLASMARF